MTISINIFYYSIIFLLILSFVIYYLYFYKNEHFNNLNDRNSWKTTLKDNWITIRDECFNIISSVPITNENRNKFW